MIWLWTWSDVFNTSTADVEVITTAVQVRDRLLITVNVTIELD